MFDLQKILRENIKNLKPYSSARDEFQGKASVYLDANENPYNSGINRYPDPLQIELKKAIGKIKGTKPENTFLGNGSDEAIDLIIRAFCEPGKDEILSIKPTYGMYQVCADINNVRYNEVLLSEDFQLDIENFKKAITKNVKVAFVCSPNNPTGNSLKKDDILDFLQSFHGILVIDEAYIDFSSTSSYLELLDQYPNLVILQTFSKAWGMAGIRLGMAFASKEITSILNAIKYPYNVNVLTQQKALKEITSNKEQIANNVAQILDERKLLQTELKNLDIVKYIYPSDANFILAKVLDAKQTYKYLCDKEIIVRDRSNVALCEGCLRITVGTPEENKAFIKALKDMN